MKFTQYFLYTRQRHDIKNIKIEWILKTVENPVKKEIQSDGRIRRWAKISEANDKYLRVVLLEDGQTIHNTFFDRSFKE